MKKISLFLLLLMPLAMMAENVTKIAVLETVDKAGNVEYGKRLYVRNTLTRAIAGTPGYEAYDRVDISSIFKELDFQRTGNVSEDQIKELGKMTGAQYVLVPEIAKMDANTFYITAKILDVETAQAVSVSGATSTTEVFSMQEACIQMANELLALPSQRDKKQKQIAINEKMKVSEGHIDEFGWEYRDGKYYQNGYIIGRREVNKKALESMKQKDQFAYNYYLSHDKKLITTGYALLPTGLMLSAGLGLGLLLYAEEGVVDGPNWAGPFASGIAIMGVGGAMMITSIPCLTIGYKRQRATIDNYLLGTSAKPGYSHNMPNSPEQPYLTFQLQTSANGFGLGMRF